MQEQCGNLCFQATDFLILQEAAETYVVGLFEDANQCTIHIKQLTVMPRTFNWPIGSGVDMVKYL